MKRVLVTGAGGSASFNYINSLRDNEKKEKFYIVGVDTNKYFIKLSDLNKSYIVPSLNDPTYLHELNKIIVNEEIDFLHIQPDSEVNFISKNRNKIKTKLLLPKANTINMCQNKKTAFEILSKNNINIPESIYPSNFNEVRRGVKLLLKKYNKVWIRAIRGAGSKAALPVIDSNHAVMWIDYWIKMKNLKITDFMLSEFLPGSEYAFQSFWVDGNLVSSQARQRIEYVFGNLTPSGQSSSPSLAKTVQIDEVNFLATNAVLSIDKKATGIFCIDMKTGSDNQVKVTEINSGRFYTTSYFFSKAGYNLPYIYTKYGIDGKLPIKLKKYNNLKKNIFWIRMIDMGYKMVKD